MACMPPCTGGNPKPATERKLLWGRCHEHHHPQPQSLLQCRHAGASFGGGGTDLCRSETDRSSRANRVLAGAAARNVDKNRRGKTISEILSFPASTRGRGGRGGAH